MKLSRHCVRSLILATAFCSIPDSGLGCCMSPPRVQHGVSGMAEPGLHAARTLSRAVIECQKSPETAAINVTEPFAK